MGGLDDVLLLSVLVFAPLSVMYSLCSTVINVTKLNVPAVHSITN